MSVRDALIAGLLPIDRAALIYTPFTNVPTIETNQTKHYEPKKTSGEENISVVVGPIAPGFRLESLGEPADAARRFLDTTVAPPGSGRTAELITAGERRDALGVLYYEFEFTVRREAGGAPFARRNVVVLAARGTQLLSLNAQCPEARWARDGEKLRAAAASFRLLPPS